MRSGKAASKALTAQGRIAAIRSGLRSRDFEKIAPMTGLSKSEWANALQISTKTLERYLKQHKTFEPLQSERILEIESLFEKGEEIFGSLDKFMQWLNHESVAMGGVIPKELLDTSMGIGLVQDELGRIDHGIFA